MRRNYDKPEVKLEKVLTEDILFASSLSQDLGVDVTDEIWD